MTEIEFPRPPTNVRIQFPDGTTAPVELTYEGLDDDGLHLWIAVSTTPWAPAGSRLLVDKIPARTCIQVRQANDRGHQLDLARQAAHDALQQLDSRPPWWAFWRPGWMQ